MEKIAKAGGNGVAPYFRSGPSLSLYMYLMLGL